MDLSATVCTFVSKIAGKPLDAFFVKIFAWIVNYNCLFRQDVATSGRQLVKCGSSGTRSLSDRPPASYCDTWGRQTMSVG